MFAHTKLALFVVCVACIGCVDPRGRFDEFGDRALVTADAGTSSDAEGDCVPPSPGRVAGKGVLAVETSTGPGKPFLFLGDVSTPEIDGRTAVLFEYRALAAEDRQTLVGPPMTVGPYAIEADGTFIAPVAEGTIPGEANPILTGLDVVSVMTLFGKICGVQKFYCGTITGELISPLKGPLTGAFGLTLLPDGKLPAQPRYGCAEDALAPPLGG